MADPKEEPRRGRPRAVEPGSTLSAWVSVSEHDRLVKVAAKRGETLSATIRDMLRTKGRDDT